MTFISIKITLKDQSEVLKVKLGQDLLSVLMEAGYPISAECGGALTCATCAIHWEENFLTASESEDDALDQIPDRKAGTRLACQCIITKNMDNCSLKIPLTSLKPVIK